MDAELKTYEEAVEYCFSVPKFTKKNDMNVTKGFLEFLDAESKKATVIHVAGTNGKGSVCAFLESIALKLGKNVASFTSPHLCDIRERIRFNGRMISKEDFTSSFCKVLAEVERFRKLSVKNCEYHPTFFELLFFIGMVYFKSCTPDVYILETGLGGRKDATNSLSRKDISIITKIGFDHMEYLGNDLASIAYEKAGIIAKNTAVVFLGQQDEVNSVISTKAKEIGSPVYQLSKDDVVLERNSDKDIAFSYHSRYYGDVSFCVETKAVYQIENALLAISAAEILWNSELTAPILQKGVNAMYHPGRMEEVLPKIFVDGAHNEDGIKAFLDTVRRDGLSVENRNGNRALLFSVVQDKQYQKMVSLLLESELFQEIGIAPIGNERSLSEQELFAIFSNRKKVQQYASVREAFTNMIQNKEQGDYLYVTGSLYLVGQIKDIIRKQG